MPKGHDYKVKKSLNFDGERQPSRSSSSLSGPSSFTQDENDSGRKRLQDEVFGSLSDDDELCGDKSIWMVIFAFNYHLNTLCINRL